VVGSFRGIPDTAEDPAHGHWSPAPPGFTDYHILTLLGRGPHGAAYLADDPAASRPVVLKLIDLPADADRNAVAALLSALTGLNHPAIVPLLAAGLLSEARAYLVSEYQQAPSLRKLMSRTPHPLARLLPIMADLADALQHALDREIAHGHVVASNAFVRGGSGRLADFGCAALAGRSGKAADDVDALCALMLEHAPEGTRPALAARLPDGAPRAPADLAAALRRWLRDPAFPA
jgi:serine/threonine protein kinase